MKERREREKEREREGEREGERVYHLNATKHVQSNNSEVAE